LLKVSNLHNVQIDIVSPAGYNLEHKDKIQKYAHHKHAYLTYPYHLQIFNHVIRHNTFGNARSTRKKMF